MGYIRVVGDSCEVAGTGCWGRELRGAVRERWVGGGAVVVVPSNSDAA